MRIPHREIEELQLNLRGWVERHRHPESVPMHSYAHATRMALYVLNKTGSIEGAQRYLSRLLDSFRLNNRQRRRGSEDAIVAYADWLAVSGAVIVHDKLRLSMDVGHDMYVSGEVPRIYLDVPSGGYSAVFLGLQQSSWRSQLRMPLVQLAVAQRVDRSPEEVSVGVQELDGSHLEIVQYTVGELDDAMEEIRHLAARAMRLLGNA